MGSYNILSHPILNFLPGTNFRSWKRIAALVEKLGFSIDRTGSFT